MCRRNTTKPENQYPVTRYRKTELTSLQIRQSFWRCGNRVEACCGQSTRGGSRTQNSHDKGTVPWYNQYTAILTVQVSKLSRDNEDQHGAVISEWIWTDAIGVL